MWRAYPNLRVMAQGRLLDTMGPSLPQLKVQKASLIKKGKRVACEWWKVPSN
jgi:hypothetical protein